MLATEAEREHGRNILIEHNLRLVVYIARKFDNTRRNGRSDFYWNHWADQSH